MKKLFIFFISFFVLFFCGCKRNINVEPVAETQVFENQTDIFIANEIEDMKTSQTFDDETIKTLSVILRTNLKNENINFSNNEYSLKNEHIYDIVKQTSGQTIEFDDEVSKQLYIEQENDDWVLEIKKFDILKFLKENNISLSSVSNISLENQEDGKTKNLNLNGKIISFEKISSYFNIPSNNIYKIENNLTSIKLYGKGKGFYENLKIEDIQKDSLKGENYQKILKNHYNNFQIITSG